eukprot:11587913-Prorocentrum_lima.AAC.1
MMIWRKRMISSWKIHLKAEDWLLSQTYYQACKEYEEKQAEYLEALDFMDILTDKLRFYNVCMAKTGTM